jgi:predicted nuclease of predicted toxin-antitoxin system
MTINYLIDENVNPLYARQLRKKEPQIMVKVVGESEIPPRGTLDPEILNWCEDNQFVLVTNNRASMPLHLSEHLAKNHHVPFTSAL